MKKLILFLTSIIYLSAMIAMETPAQITPLEDVGTLGTDGKDGFYEKNICMEWVKVSKQKFDELYNILKLTMALACHHEF